MELYDRITCDICGKGTTLSENHALEDGKICPDCAQKLSPLFENYRRATVEQIRRHLAYREENRKKLENFSPNLIFCGSKKVYIDPCRNFLVTTEQDWRSGNPDLIDLSQVWQVHPEIHEIYRPLDGGIEYAFLVTILVDSPWFEQIELELSAGNRPTDPDCKLFRDDEQKLWELSDILMRRDSTKLGSEDTWLGSARKPAKLPAEPPPPQKPEAWHCPGCGTRNLKNFCTNCGAPKPAVKTRPGCTKCGWKPEEGETRIQYCPECGSRLP